MSMSRENKRSISTSIVLIDRSKGTIGESTITPHECPLTGVSHGVCSQSFTYYLKRATDVSVHDQTDYNFFLNSLFLLRLIFLLRRRLLASYDDNFNAQMISWSNESEKVTTTVGTNRNYLAPWNSNNYWMLQG